MVSTGKKGRKTVGSTSIRQLITKGNIVKAAKLLGRPVSILGRVMHGDARGGTLGYPTANIMPTKEVIPPSGVYLVKVIFKNKRYNGIANVGRRPSFKRLSKVNIEVHIFDFKKNLYAQDIIIEFFKKIRDEKIFLSKEDLIRQIQSDEKKAIKWFATKK
jgi:riboflavin kinase/FMN adenylyltransferase